MDLVAGVRKEGSRLVASLFVCHVFSQRIPIKVSLQRRPRRVQMVRCQKLDSPRKLPGPFRYGARGSMATKSRSLMVCQGRRGFRGGTGPPATRRASACQGRRGGSNGSCTRTANPTQGRRKCQPDATRGACKNTGGSRRGGGERIGERITEEPRTKA
jgi:hypothetical protein